MKENSDYLHSQLITYIGNKRSLLPFIEEGVKIVKSELKKEKLSTFDGFAGSGIVSRFLKQHSSSVTVNDLENYACLISECYLSNVSKELLGELKDFHAQVCAEVDARLNAFLQGKDGGGRGEQNFAESSGFIYELYAPKSEKNIKREERCFYTPRNAAFIDICRQVINEKVPSNLQHFFIAPLLSEVSIHANTAGIFKGFYKNSKTKTGQFGGNGSDALSRILGKIELPFPIFSYFECPFNVFNEDANLVVNNEDLYSLTEDGSFDLAYFDPPYNQHPYGSNYFMLNLVASYEKPDVEKISKVSGIPKNWNRSVFNKKRFAKESFSKLVKDVRAKYLLISFNSEGFISKDEMISLLEEVGTVQVLESSYNTFRGSRNLENRNIHVKEYLFLVKKH